MVFNQARLPCVIEPSESYRVNASVLENLAALQEIDRRNRERQLELADIERQTAAQQALLDEKTRYVDVLRAETGATGSRRRELEGQLQEEEQRMKERRMRLGRLRNDKEVAALQREIEVAKEANARLEEETLTLIEQVEALEGNLRAAEVELALLVESVATVGKSGDGRVQQLRTEMESEAAERDAIASRLDDGIRKKYEQIFARRGGVAVVEVREGSCSGCNMNIPRQLSIEIQRQRDVRVCPNCHRILYWRAELVSEDSADEA